jgi:hypothetical protein
MEDLALGACNFERLKGLWHVVESSEVQMSFQNNPFSSEVIDGTRMNARESICKQSFRCQFNTSSPAGHRKFWDCVNRRAFMFTMQVRHKTREVLSVSGRGTSCRWGLNAPGRRSSGITKSQISLVSEMHLWCCLCLESRQARDLGSTSETSICKLLHMHSLTRPSFPRLCLRPIVCLCQI